MILKPALMKTAFLPMVMPIPKGKSVPDPTADAEKDHTPERDSPADEYTPDQPERVLNTQGFFEPTPQPAGLPARPTVVQSSPPDDSLLQQLEVSSSEDEMDAEENVDVEEPPQSDHSLLQRLSAVSKKPKMQRKKIGRRTPGKILSGLNIPLRKSTAPTLVTTRRNASEDSKDSEQQDAPT